GNTALAIYSTIGLLIGFISAGVTKVVYWIEDAFEKLPVHWMWWPMIGGIVVGVVGYFAPATLGVGYDNITHLLSGTMTIGILLSLCFLKFISWSVALGSGTSGGTLAPLLTIGGAAGALMGAGFQIMFPDSGIALPLAVLVGMSAMFAGASRALLTSIVFAVETTGQTHALLPLLAACVASYLVSYLLMKNTIMTEKIARRGVATPHVYEPDILDNITVDKVMREEAVIIGHEAILSEIREWLLKNRQRQQNFYVVADEEGQFKGIVSSSNLFSMHHEQNTVINDLIKRKPLTVGREYSLKQVVEIMARENLDVLAVKGTEDNKIIGVISYRDVLSAYRMQLEQHEENRTIFLKERALRFFAQRKRKLSVLRHRTKI
ncbi:MAG TPA: chloride channel protein, partial [Flavisolibacter sp.]|nr:chloride channel protein [Flavisolibacter sp.]